MAEEISPLEDHGWWMERLRKDAKANRPEALRLAAQLEDAESARLHLLPYAAAELRRLHDIEKAYESACKIIDEQDKKLKELDVSGHLTSEIEWTERPASWPGRSRT